MWILILTLFIGNQASPAITSVGPFYTFLACEKAATDWKTSIEKSKVSNYARIIKSSICVYQ